MFLATHDYVILEELDLRKEKTDAVAFHSLYHKKDDKEVVCNTADGYLEIAPNAIAETFESLYDREVERSLRGALK